MIYNMSSAYLCYFCGEIKNELMTIVNISVGQAGYCCNSCIRQRHNIPKEDYKYEYSNPYFETEVIKSEDITTKINSEDITKRYGYPYFYTYGCPLEGQ